MLSVYGCQWSHQFELLNYSEFGSVVDDVRYACDGSTAVPRSSMRSSRQRPASTNSGGVNELRQLMANRVVSSTHGRNDERNVSLSTVKTVCYYSCVPAVLRLAYQPLAVFLVMQENICHVLVLLSCLRCFDTVGWVAGRAFGLHKLSDEMLACLSVLSAVQMICMVQLLPLPLRHLLLH